MNKHQELIEAVRKGEPARIIRGDEVKIIEGKS
jgi:hypothetical protein